MTPKRFHGRAFAATTAALAGLGLPPTGLANHLLQVAPFTTARHAWMAAHVSLAVVFSIAVIWHAILNRKALAGYLRGSTDRLRSARREAIWALTVVTVVLTVAVGHAFHVR